MGTYTLTNFKTRLVFNLGNRDDVDTLTTHWVNASYLNLCSRNKFWEFRVPKSFTFPELDDISDKSTADGVEYITKPSKCLFVRTIWDRTNDVRLTYRNFRWYIEQADRADTSAEDEPEYWTSYGNKIYVYPTPDATYNLRIYYRRKPNLMDGSTYNTTEIGDEWDEPILMLATVQSLMRLGEFDKAKVWKEEFVDTVKGLMNMQDREAIDTTEHFRLDYGYSDFSY